MEWMEADELNKLKLLQKLPLWNDKYVCSFFNPTLLNSYLMDLFRCIGSCGYDEKDVPDGDYINKLIHKGEIENE